jgi:MIP family channel proteins
MKELGRKCLAECFGTFAMVFAGTGAIIVDHVSQGAVTQVGIALTFGLIVFAMIYALGDVSGCHINPVVTIAFCFARRFDVRHVIPYIAAQFSGALLASCTLRLMFPDQSHLGQTVPSGGYVQSFIMEFILTLILMIVILCVSSGSKENGPLAGLAIGSVVCLEAMFAGPISGASMNPVRSLAPAILTSQFASISLYMTAPFLGAIISVFLYQLMHPPIHNSSKIETS